MFSSQHIAKISVTKSNFTYFCSLPYIIIKYTYHRITCGLYWLHNKLKQLHMGKHYSCIVPLNPTMSRISLILHKAEAKLRPSVNIKDILRMQVGFNCLLSHKAIMLLMLPMTCKGFNRFLLMYINTYGAYVNS